MKNNTNKTKTANAAKTEKLGVAKNSKNNSEVAKLGRETSESTTEVAVLSRGAEMDRVTKQILIVASVLLNLFFIVGYVTVCVQNHW